MGVFLRKRVESVPEAHQSIGSLRHLLNHIFSPHFSNWLYIKPHFNTQKLQRCPLNHTGDVKSLPSAQRQPWALGWVWTARSQLWTSWNQPEEEGGTSWGWFPIPDLAGDSGFPALPEFPTPGAKKLRLRFPFLASARDFPAALTMSSVATKGFWGLLGALENSGEWIQCLTCGDSPWGAQGSGLVCSLSL